MYIKHTLFRLHKIKSGIATILGMLIFVGVFFTCIMPFFLYINTVNSYYDQAVIEMKRFDEEREREMIDVYAYPLGEQDHNINIYMKSKCPMEVNITRVWINDQNFPVSRIISGMYDNTTGPIDVSILLPTTEGESKDFRVKVTTTRGNSFASLTNPLRYTVGEGGGWACGIGFAINIVLEMEPSFWGWWYWFWWSAPTYNFKVSDASDPNQIFCNDNAIIATRYSESYIKLVNVPGPGTYSVTVSRKNWGSQTWTIIKSENVMLDWDNPSKWVYATDE